jgi:VCBS repeat-containing protein
LKTGLSVSDLVGTYTLTVKATDGFGNVSEESFTFTVAPSSIIQSPIGTTEQPVQISNDNESVTIKVFEQPSVETGAAITQVNGIKVVNGRVELVDDKGNNKGYVIISGETAEFFADGNFSTLNKLQTENVTLNFTVADNAGNSIEVEKTVTINGSNKKPVLADNTVVTRSVDEGCSVDVSFEDLLGKWSDDDDETLTVNENFVVDSIVKCPAGFDSVFTADTLATFVTFDESKLTFDATNDVFSQLAAGESVVVRLMYKVSDGELESDEFGYIEITINGLNEKPVFNAENTFNVDEKTVHKFEASQIAIDPNGDILTISKVQVDGVTVNSGETGALADGTEISIVEGVVTIDLMGRTSNLAEGESEVLMLSVTVVDTNGGETDGEVTLTINGVNETPVINVPENLAIEINGNAIGSDIELGQLTITDADDDFVPATEQVPVYTDEEGKPVEIDATAFVDADGKIYINFTELPDIEPGGSLDCRFTVTFDDGNTNGKISQTINVKLIAASGPRVDITNPETVGFNEATTPKNVVFGVEVSDTSGDERTGSDWYEIKNGVTVAVSSNTARDFTEAFNTSKDSFFAIEETASGQQLRFKVTNANIFNFLNVDETLTLTYTFEVTDIAKDVTTTKSVTITIRGENSLPTYNDKNINNHNTSISENDSAVLNVLSIWSDADSAHTEKKSLNIVGVDGTELPVATVKSVSGTKEFNVGNIIDGLISITTKKSNGIKQITFTPGTTFDALAEDESVELEIRYKIADSFAVSDKTGIVILTVNGANDAPTISVVEQLEDVLWTGQTQGGTVVVGTFDADDIDDDELTTTVVEGTTEVWDGEKWVSTDKVEFSVEDGKIKITFVNDIELSDGESARYRFKLQTSDGLVTTETDYAEVKVTTLYNPVVDDVNVTRTESDTEVSETISVTDPNNSGHEFLISDLFVAAPTYSNSDLYKDVVRDLTDCFNIENEIFTFDAGDRFAFLNAGDSVTLTFTYTVTDNVYNELTTTGMIIVTITGENSSPVYVEPSGDLATPEVDADNKEGIELSPLDNWNDPDLGQTDKSEWTVIPETGDDFTAVITGRSNTMNESSAFDDKFVVDTSYDNLVTFDDGKLLFVTGGVFAGLRAGDYVDLEISYRVVDEIGTKSDVRTEMVRVNGVNDQVDVTVTNDSFYVWTSVIGAEDSKILDPEFVVSDNDIGEVVTFEIMKPNVTGSGLEYWDGLTDEVKEKLFTIDSSTGVITIDVSLLENLTAGKDLMFTLNVSVSNTSSETLSKTVTVEVMSPKAPSVNDGEKNITESKVTTEEIRIGLNELISDLNSSRSGDDWYSITDVEAKVDGFVITGKWSFDRVTNEIVFNARDTFLKLAKDESAIVTFNFTVKDNYYNRSTNGTTTLTITGENNAPTLCGEDKEIDFRTITVGGEPSVINISDCITDIDNGDRIRVTAINDKPLVEGKVTIDGIGSFVYDDEEGTLSYTDNDSDFFWNISVNFPETIKFTFTVADEQGEELVVDATVTVQGINAQPVINNVPSYEVDDAHIIVIDARAIASDRNTNDTLTFVRVGGIDVTPEMQIKAEGGVTITFSDDLTKMYFNRSTLLGMDYQKTAEGGRVSGTYESLMLSIVVQDDSKEETSVSELGDITFVIKGVGSKVDDGGEDDIADVDNDGDSNVGNDDNNDGGGNVDNNVGDVDDNKPEVDNGDTSLLGSTPTNEQKPVITDNENQTFDKELDPDGKKQTVGQIVVESDGSYTFERVTGSFTRNGAKITNPGFTVNFDGTITIAKGKLGNFVDGKYQFAVNVTADDGTSYKVNVTVNITVIQTATDQALASFSLYDDLFNVDYSDELKQNKKETAVIESDDESVIDKVFAEFYNEYLRNTA